MKSLFSVVVLSAALSSVGFAKEDNKNTCWECKVNGTAVEVVAGKSCLNAKDKKKATKDCKAKGGKWEKGATTAGTTGTETAPASDTTKTDEAAPATEGTAPAQ